MKRQIFLIKGHSNNDVEFNVATEYMNYYSGYFKSLAGGVFEDDEICILKDPKVEELKFLIDEMKPDYAIIVLIGHGATQEDFQLFQINVNEVIRAGQMQLEIRKQLIILESCRVEIEKISTVDLTAKTPNYREGGKLRRLIEKKQAKQKYIERLIECHDGVVVCFACRKGEYAWNYYFSQYLIQTSFNWHADRNNKQEILSITTLMNIISQNLPKLINERINVDQNPEILGNVDYPFAISKFHI